MRHDDLFLQRLEMLPDGFSEKKRMLTPHMLSPFSGPGPVVNLVWF